MFTDILKIIPKIENKDMEKMQKSLQGRFAKIAKGFGKSLVSVFAGGGLIGAGLAMINKLINPLKEVQEAIDRTLTGADNISTYAKQFNTTSGKLFKLIQLGTATGLDEQTLFTLLAKFQTATASARLNPDDPMASSVKAFSNRDDTADAFFEFIQSMQKMDKGQQALVQEQIFGTRAILKTADFLQQDFPELIKKIGLDRVGSGGITSSIEKQASIADLSDILTARRNTKDVFSKGRLINEGMAYQKDKAERIKLERENQQIASYKSLATIDEKMSILGKQIEKGFLAITDLSSKAIKFFETTGTIMQKFDKTIGQSKLLKIGKSIFGKGD